MSQERSKWTDKAIVFLTAGIVVAAILQTRIFEKQWKEMHDSGTGRGQAEGPSISR